MHGEGGGGGEETGGGGRGYLEKNKNKLKALNLLTEMFLLLSIGILKYVCIFCSEIEYIAIFC